ncbi:MAG: TetR/AcrR family transcriptional regulator [Armatimonadota bacterium]
MDNQSQTSWKERRKEQLHEEFIATASGLFRASGFDDVSVDDIVGATGVAKGTFYLYFKTKADIVQAVLDHFLQNLEERTSAALADTSGDAASGLRAVVATLMSFLQENPGMLAPIIENSLDNHQLAPEIKEELRARCRAATTSIYERMFRMGMLQGYYREIDPIVASFALQGMLGSLIHRAIETHESFQDAGETALELLERGIGRRRLDA